MTLSFLYVAFHNQQQTIIIYSETFAVFDDSKYRGL